MPQYIILILAFISLLIGANKHGKIETETKSYNFWITLISNILVLGLLYWGGFFDQLLSKF